MKTKDAFVNELVDVVNAHLTEIGGQATPTSSFEDLDIDSLTCVELSVFLGQRYDVEVAEIEVATAGNFTALAELIHERMNGAAL